MQAHRFPLRDAGGATVARDGTPTDFAQEWRAGGYGSLWAGFGVGRGGFGMVDYWAALGSVAAVTSALPAA